MLASFKPLEMFRKTSSRAGETTAARIAQIISPNVVEVQAKRNARFGRLNVAAAFDISAHVRDVDFRGDVRREFARRIAIGTL